MKPGFESVTVVWDAAVSGSVLPLGQVFTLFPADLKRHICTYLALAGPFPQCAQQPGLDLDKTKNLEFHLVSLGWQDPRT